MIFLLQEDLLIHGDSVYDIIEKQDHQTIQNELVRASNPLNATPNDSRIFLCRMNVSRRQLRFGDQKVSNYSYSCTVAFKLLTNFCCFFFGRSY